MKKTLPRNGTGSRYRGIGAEITPQFAALARERTASTANGTLEVSPMNRPVFDPKDADKQLTTVPWDKVTTGDILLLEAHLNRTICLPCGNTSCSKSAVKCAYRAFMTTRPGLRFGEVKQNIVGCIKIVLTMLDVESRSVRLFPSRLESFVIGTYYAFMAARSCLRFGKKAEHDIRTTFAVVAGLHPNLIG